MPAVVVIGGQWGDEGKGRIVDLIAQGATVVARYSAGNNAGHTVINDLGEFKLNLVPAGIFYPEKACLIGNGVAVDPAALLNEIDQLSSRGISVANLFVSDRCHAIMPWHVLIDVADEKLRGDAAIGTTGRGVGPCFTDKVARIGIRIGDLVDPEALRARLQFVLPYKNAVLERLYGLAPLPFDDVYAQYAEHGRRLAPFVRDTAQIVHEALDRGETVLLEGAQGCLLDLDAGTYEYVTSSVPSSSAGGAGIGIGIGPTVIQQVVGIYKAYMTRVGNGPMPSELLDETGTILRKEGPRPEVGTTTGRPRRTGWFDAVASRYSAMVNGVTSGVLTRLDVLDNFPSISICVAYETEDGRTLTTLPASSVMLSKVRPVYEEVEGWMAPTSGCRTWDDLPPKARDYIRRIERLLGIPVDIVSVGPERDQAIIVHDVLKVRPRA
ncbi:MAG TPA: adenylosuccinate synthase [Dehalococcoidia bacterium]|jgi:adenylosuccinate synthase|nr:adenylosuccinate synthase [Dehalococcoidia bacterium]